MSENIYSWFLRELIQENKKILISKAKGESIDEYKRKLLNDLIKKVNENSKNNIDLVLNIIKEIKNKLINLNYKIYEFDVKTKSRLLVNIVKGLGSALFELGISFHPIFNLPYIPSSSIKGSLRSYFELSGIDEKTIEEIFGSQEIVSNIIILDAFPVEFNKTLLEPEVTTAIYGEKIKEIDAKPNPIIYPCIAQDVTFRFLIAIRNTIDKERKEKISKLLTKYIGYALKYGIGAKTLLGYGELEVINKNIKGE